MRQGECDNEEIYTYFLMVLRYRICTGLTEAAYHLLTAEVYAEWVCDKCLQSKNIPLVKFKPWKSSSLAPPTQSLPPTALVRVSPASFECCKKNIQTYKQTNKKNKPIPDRRKKEKKTMVKIADLLLFIFFCLRSVLRRALCKFVH